MRGENNMKTKNKSNAKIPKTGKIGNLAKNIKKQAGEEVLYEIFQDIGKFQETKDRSVQADWFKNAVQKLEKQTGPKKAREIMATCGRDCCNQNFVNKAKQKMKESESLEEFLEKMSGSGYNFQLKDKNTIIGEYKKCYCYMVNKTRSPFSTNTYCHCGLAHIQKLFEESLGKSIKVKLVQSIITGAKTCRFLIHI